MMVLSAEPDDLILPLGGASTAANDLLTFLELLPPPPLVNSPSERRKHLMWWPHSSSHISLLFTLVLSSLTPLHTCPLIPRSSSPGGEEEVSLHPSGLTAHHASVCFSCSSSSPSVLRFTLLCLLPPSLLPPALRLLLCLLLSVLPLGSRR